MFSTHIFIITMITRIEDQKTRRSFCPKSSPVLSFFFLSISDPEILVSRNVPSARLLLTRILMTKGDDHPNNNHDEVIWHQLLYKKRRRWWWWWWWWERELRIKRMEYGCIFRLGMPCDQLSGSFVSNSSIISIFIIRIPFCTAWHHHHHHDPTLQ